MPLVQDNVSKSTRNHFLDQRQKDRNHHDPISRSHTPSNAVNETRTRRSSGTSTDSSVTNPLGAKDVMPIQNEKYQKAIAMKMQVPDAFGYRTNTAGKKSFEVAPAENAGMARVHQDLQTTTYHDLHTNFDDTTSLPFDDESSLQENENRTVVFRGGPAQPSRVQPPQSRHGQTYNSTFDSTTPLQEFGIDIPHDWQEQVQAERRFQEQERLYTGQKGVALHDMERSEYPRENHTRTVTDAEVQGQTPPPPRFTRSAPPTKMVSFNSPGNKNGRAARADSPELEIPRKTKSVKALANSQDTELPVDTARIVKSHQVSNMNQHPNKSSSSNPLFDPIGRDRGSLQQPHVNNIDSSRASDYPTSSDDEFPTIHPESPVSQATPEGQNSRKRQRDDEIDYDIDALKAMKYEELHQQNFGRDPRKSTHGGGFDSHGNTKTLSQRLVNLDKMTEDEQKIMFHSQNDEEWTQMGSWFIERFQEGLKKLIEIRIERRKTSSRFEDEIRKRQKSIEWCSAGLEQEFRDLKKGGGELIRGRDAPSIRGTPQKN